MKMTNKQFDILREDLALLRSELRHGLSSIESKVSAHGEKIAVLENTTASQEEVAAIKAEQHGNRRRFGLGLTILGVLVGAVEIFLR
jgi:hypothetical protein